MPGIPGLAWIVAGRPHALPLLGAGIGLALITAVLNAFVVMYQARQETRRRQIERPGADVLADALARCIDDTHAKPQNLSRVGSEREAADIRAGATGTLDRLLPAVLALMNQPSEQAQTSQQTRRS